MSKTVWGTFAGLVAAVVRRAIHNHRRSFDTCVAQICRQGDLLRSDRTLLFASDEQVQDCRRETGFR